MAGKQGLGFIVKAFNVKRQNLASVPFYLFSQGMEKVYYIIYTV